MLVVGSMQTVSRHEIKMMYCLLSRPTHARSGEIGDWRLEATYQVFANGRSLSSMTRFCFRGQPLHEDCGVLPVISLIDLAPFGTTVRGKHAPTAHGFLGFELQGADLCLNLP